MKVFIFYICLIFVFIIVVSPVFAKVYDNAKDVLKEFSIRRGKVANFQGNIYFTRQSSGFLNEVFGISGLQEVQQGLMNYASPDFFQVILKQTDGTEVKFLSNDGFSFGAVRVSITGEVLGIGPVTDRAQELRKEVSLANSPLAFVFPYQSLQILPGEKYVMQESEVVYAQPCYVFDVKSPFRGDHKIWINQNGYYVMRIDWTDPHDGKLIQALYNNFVPVRGEEFWIYTYLQVLKEKEPLYYVEMTSQEANLPPKELAGVNFNPPKNIIIPHPIWREGVSSIRYFKDPLTGRYVTSEKVGTSTPFTPLQILITILMGGGLLYLIGRLYVDLSSREIFSKELMVVDKQKGDFINRLRSAGLAVTRFTPELLTEERKIVGIRRGKQQPRAILVAPDAIETIKDYFFLLRAYLDEGGRVIILPHSESERKKMPFQLATVKYNPQMEGYLLHSRMNIWKKALPNEVENMLSPYLAPEMIVAVDESPIDKEILTLHNKQMGIRGYVAGVMKQGKGEVLFLQLNILELPDTSEKSILRRAIEDILNYFQNRPEDNHKEKK